MFQAQRPIVRRRIRSASPLILFVILPLIPLLLWISEGFTSLSSASVTSSSSSLLFTFAQAGATTAVPTTTTTRSTTTTAAPLNTRDPRYDTEHREFCNFVLSSSQTTGALYQTVSYQSLTSFKMENRRCVTPYGGQRVMLDVISNIIDYNEEVVTTTPTPTTSTSAFPTTNSGNVTTSTSPATTASNATSGATSSAAATTEEISNGSTTTQPTPSSLHSAFHIAAESLSATATTTPTVLDKDGLPPVYQNPYAKYPILFEFYNTTFIGSSSQIVFVGIEAERPMLQNIMTKMRDIRNNNGGADSEYNFLQDINANFAASFLTDYFSDERIDLIYKARLDGSKLKWNQTIRRRFSNFIKKTIVESPLTAPTASVPVPDAIALKRPLQVALQNCRFIGGATITFKGIMPVGTNITILNSSFIATYNQLFDDTTTSMAPEIFYRNRGFINFQRMYLLGGNMYLGRNRVKILRSPATSPNSSFFSYDTSSQTGPIDAALDPDFIILYAHTSFINAVDTLMLHSSKIEIEDIKMSAEGMACDRSAFLHPNASGLQRVLNNYRVAAEVKSFLRVRQPVQTVSIFTSSEYQRSGIFTERSQLKISKVRAMIDGRSVLVPASDSMWITSTSPASAYAATTTRVTSTSAVPNTTAAVPSNYSANFTVTAPPLQTTSPAPLPNITLETFYRDYPNAFPRKCFVLEVPTLVQFNVMKSQFTILELTQNSVFDVSEVSIKSRGSQPRGGKYARNTELWPTASPSSPSSIPTMTNVSLYGSGNSYELQLDRITDAVAMKVVLEIAEVLGSVFSDGIGYSTDGLAPPAASYRYASPIVDTPFSDAYRLKSGLSNASLINKFKLLESEIFGHSFSLSGNSESNRLAMLKRLKDLDDYDYFWLEDDERDGIAEITTNTLYMLLVSDFNMMYYRYSPTRATSSESSRRHYDETIFNPLATAFKYASESSVPIPITNQFSEQLPFDNVGIAGLHRFCGVQNTIGVSERLISLLRAAKINMTGGANISGSWTSMGGDGGYHYNPLNNAIRMELDEGRTAMESRHIRSDDGAGGSELPYYIRKIRESLRRGDASTTFTPRQIEAYYQYTNASQQLRTTIQSYYLQSLYFLDYKGSLSGKAETTQGVSPSISVSVISGFLSQTVKFNVSSGFSVSSVAIDLRGMFYVSRIIGSLLMRFFESSFVNLHRNNSIFNTAASMVTASSSTTVSIIPSDNFFSTYGIGALKMTGLYPIQATESLISALDTRSGMVMSEPNSHIVIQDFNVKLTNHKTNIYFLVCAVYFDVETSTSVYMNGNNVSVTVRDVVFDVESSLDNRLRSLVYTTEVAAIKFDSSIAMDGEDHTAYTNIRPVDPATNLEIMTIYPIPPTITIVDVYFNTSIDYGNSAAAKFSTSALDVHIFSQASLLISKIHFLDQILRFSKVLNDREQFYTTILQNDARESIIANQGLIRISDIYQSRENPIAPVCRTSGIRIVFVGILSVSRQMTVSDDGRIEIENMEWMMCASCRGDVSWAVLQSAGGNIFISDGGIIVVSSMSIGNLVPTITYVSQIVEGPTASSSGSSTAVFSTVPPPPPIRVEMATKIDLMTKSGHITTVTNINSGQLRISGRSKYLLQNISAEFFFLGSNTVNARASFHTQNEASQLTVATGGQYVIRNSKLTVTPYDAPESEREMMRSASALATIGGTVDSGGSSTVPPTTDSSNRWQWSNFRTLPGNRDESLTFGGLTSPANAVCALLDFHGIVYIGDNKLLDPTASIIDGGGYGQIIVEDVDANIFCGVNIEMKQEEAEIAFPTNNNDRRLVPISTVYTGFSDSTSFSINSFEGFIFKNVRSSVFYSHVVRDRVTLTRTETFAPTITSIPTTTLPTNSSSVSNDTFPNSSSTTTTAPNATAGPSSNVVNYTVVTREYSVWRPAAYPLLYGRFNVFDYEAAYSINTLSDFASDLPRNYYYFSDSDIASTAGRSSSGGSGFNSVGALRSIFQLCGIGLNGEDIPTITSTPMFYPYGWAGGVDPPATTTTTTLPTTTTTATTLATTTPSTTAPTTTTSPTTTTTAEVQNQTTLPPTATATNESEPAATNSSSTSTTENTTLTDSGGAWRHFAAMDGTSDNSSTLSPTAPSITSDGNSTFDSNHSTEVTSVLTATTTTLAPPPSTTTTTVTLPTTTTLPATTLAPTDPPPFVPLPTNSSNTNLLQDWIMRGAKLTLTTQTSNFGRVPLTYLSNSYLLNHPSYDSYIYTKRAFVERYVGFCPRTETREITRTIPQNLTISQSAGNISQSLSANDTSMTGTPSRTRLNTESPTLTLTKNVAQTRTETVTFSKSLEDGSRTQTASKSNSEECDESTIMEAGQYWRTHVISQQMNSRSSWWQRVLESNVLEGLQFHFTTGISMPPNISSRPRPASSLNGHQIKARAIMYKAASTPSDRPINFHGIRGASSPSYPYVVATVTDGVNVLLEMRALPEFEIYAPEWWDIYLPASFVVTGPCAQKLLDNPHYNEMWGAISPGPEVLFVSDDGLNPKENIYVYFTTVVIEPNVEKPLADFAEGFAAAANGLAIAVGALSSTVIASASAEVQAVGIFAHMESCNSPQITAFFGSPWVLSPVYFYEVFKEDNDTETGDERAKMLGVLVGNFSLIVVALIVQLLICLMIFMCCDPSKETTPSATDETSVPINDRSAAASSGNFSAVNASRANFEPHDKELPEQTSGGFSEKMSIFGLARFPSVTLSIMFGIHGGSVFAASRLVRLVDFDEGKQVVKYFVPAIIVLVYYIVLPIVLYISAWWCIPRTFQIYDLNHRSIRRAIKHPWLTKLLPVGAIFPVDTRQSAGIFISSFRRSSHFWVTSPLWVSTLTGIIGFAQLNDVNDSYGACFTWGIIMGVVFVLMAVVLLWRMPKRHMLLTILDVTSLLALAVLFGFTIPWRQVVYPPQERFSEGQAGKINWPDLAVVILSFIVVGLVALRAIISLVICGVELHVQKINPPTYIIWSHKSGGQIRADRLANINRIETDKVVLEEMFLQASHHDTTFPKIKSFAYQNDKQHESSVAAAAPPLPLKGGKSAQKASAMKNLNKPPGGVAPAAPQQRAKKSRILASAGFRGIDDISVIHPIVDLSTLMDDDNDDATNTTMLLEMVDMGGTPADYMNTTTTTTAAASHAPKRASGDSESRARRSDDDEDGEVDKEGEGDKTHHYQQLSQHRNPHIGDVTNSMIRSTGSKPKGERRTAASYDPHRHHRRSDRHGEDLPLGGQRVVGVTVGADTSNLGVIFDEDTFAIIDDTFVDDILFGSPTTTAAVKSPSASDPTGHDGGRGRGHGRQREEKQQHAVVEVPDLSPIRPSSPERPQLSSSAVAANEKQRMQDDAAAAKPTRSSKSRAPSPDSRAGGGSRSPRILNTANAPHSASSPPSAVRFKE